MKFYGLDGLPITLTQARALIHDLDARTVGDTLIVTTEGVFAVTTRHSLYDQTPPTRMRHEHVPLLYSTQVFNGVQRPRPAAFYSAREAACAGHARVVTDVIATCPGRIVRLEESIVPQLH